MPVVRDPAWPPERTAAAGAGQRMIGKRGSISHLKGLGRASTLAE